MKSRTILLSLIILATVVLSACSKSEEDRMREARLDRGIEHLASEDVLDHIVEAKMAHLSIFNGTNDVEVYEDNDGMVYNPFFEQYDSPEKIRAEIEKYYYGDYAEEIIDTIPAVYIDGVYVLPLGDIGYIDDFNRAILLEKKDIDEENIEVSYRLNEADDYHIRVRLIYDEGNWKVASEIVVFEEDEKEE